jgi:hypothetical protein
MTAATATSKGQVTISKPVRDHLGIGPGRQILAGKAFMQYRSASGVRPAPFKVGQVISVHVEPEADAM